MLFYRLTQHLMAAIHMLGHQRPREPLRFMPVGLETTKSMGYWGYLVIASFNVTKLSSNIVCSVSSKNVELGEKVTVSGQISPPVDGISVTLSYEKPDGSTIQRSVITSSDGSFSETYTPDISEEWSVTGRWHGD